MPDQLDLVRRLFVAINRGDVASLEACYHHDCVLEHVFLDDDGVVEGRGEVRARWAAELAQYDGALPGGRRVEVARVAGMETGWGWVRADWVAALMPVAGGVPRHFAGHSHFWVERGEIRRHRSIAREVPALAPPDARPAAGGRRDYPARPVVGVGAVVLTADGRVVLVKRRFEPLAGQWSLPGGALDVGETLEAGVAREIREETGLVIDVGPVVEVFDRILVDEAGRVRFHFVLIDYLCRPRPGPFDLAAGSDVSDVALADPGDLARYRMSEKPRDVIERALEMARRGAAAD